MAENMETECFEFLRPLLRALDEKLDVRLVRTIAGAVVAMVRHRNRALALLLSELGAMIAGPKHGPAGTKRLDRLIRSERWKAEEIEDYVLDEARLLMLNEAALGGVGRALCILDGSVLEKPETTSWRDYLRCTVPRPRGWLARDPRWARDTTEASLAPPIVVPGFEWISALIQAYPQLQGRIPHKVRVVSCQTPIAPWAGTGPFYRHCE